jgi:hypothetical protein
MNYESSTSPFPPLVPPKQWFDDGDSQKEERKAHYQKWVEEVYTPWAKAQRIRCLARLKVMVALIEAGCESELEPDALKILQEFVRGSNYAPTYKPLV